MSTSFLTRFLGKNGGSYLTLNTIRNVGGEPRALSEEPSPLPESEGKGLSPISQTDHQAHWTVKMKYELSLEDTGILLETILGKILFQNFLTIEEYFIISDLYFRIKDGVRNHRLYRLGVGVEIILNLHLSFEERKDLIIKLYRNTGSDILRIYGSRKKHWLPEKKFIVIKTVPLETYMDQTGKGEPYSSYCKGYGEGSSRGPLRTPPSAELDGEEEEPPLEDNFYRIISSVYSILVSTFRKVTKKEEES